MEIFKTGGKETIEKEKIRTACLMITMLFLPDIWHSVCAGSNNSNHNNRKSSC